MADAEARFERQYPARPIVGVGAVILVEPSDRTVISLPGALPEPYGVVLIKRRFEPLAGHWSLPGGMLETGETLKAGVAREVLEETGLVVEVGAVVEVIDRIMRDDQDRVRHHYVILDYLCQPIGGTLRFGSDVSEALVVDPATLVSYAVTPQVEMVVRRALEMRAGAVRPSAQQQSGQ